jgi:uncharacterized protein (DUF362 family)
LNKEEGTIVNLVSFVRVPISGQTALKKSIKESLDLVNFNFSRAVKKIVIKPNMCYYYHPSTGEVTDPCFIGALVDVLKENLNGYSEIMVVESDASAMKCKYAFKMLGYDRICAEKDIELVNLTEKESREAQTEIRGSQFTFQIPKIFSEADLIINVPKPKYMKEPRVTCALKNFYGCNAYPKKSVYHKVLDDAIVFVNKQIRTDLVVFDGLMVVGRHTKRLNMIISSQNPVAADAATSMLMGISPRSVRHIVLASKEGIGNMDFSPVGDFSHFKKTFPRIVLRDKIRSKAASLYLRIFG